jgi:small subunit ribosomal protein S12
MVSLRQLFYKRIVRLKKKHKKRNTALRKCPQKKGVIMKLFTESPKKPNSANRRVASVFISSIRKRIRVQIPGESLGGLQKFSRVLIRGGHTRDLPGIRYRIIRGKFDSQPLFNRRTARSKYGLKRDLGVEAVFLKHLIK